jgi:Tfp pilus assembly protein FimT
VLRYRLRGAAWQLAGDVRLARQRAVTLRKRFRVCVTSCAIAVPVGAYSVERDDGTTGAARWVSDVGAATRLPEGVSVAATLTPTFHPTGAASGATFRLSNVLGAWEVKVAATGRVLVCAPGECE